MGLDDIPVEWIAVGEMLESIDSGEYSAKKSGASIVRWRGHLAGSQGAAVAAGGGSVNLVDVSDIVFRAPVGEVEEISRQLFLVAWSIFVELHIVFQPEIESGLEGQPIQFLTADSPDDRVGDFGGVFPLHKRDFSRNLPCLVVPAELLRLLIIGCLGVDDGVLPVDVLPKAVTRIRCPLEQLRLIFPFPTHCFYSSVSA